MTYWDSAGVVAVVLVMDMMRVISAWTLTSSFPSTSLELKRKRRKALAGMLSFGAMGAESIEIKAGCLSIATVISPPSSSCETSDTPGGFGGGSGFSSTRHPVIATPLTTGSRQFVDICCVNIIKNSFAKHTPFIVVVIHGTIKIGAASMVSARSATSLPVINASFR